MVEVDGSSNVSRCGAGIALKSPAGDEYDIAVRLNFRATNNEAEYEALITGMKASLDMGARRISALTNSQLVYEQLRGTYEAKEEHLAKYLQIVRQLSTSFQEFNLAQIPKTENEWADSLSKLASSCSGSTSRTILFKTLATPQILDQVQIMPVGISEEGWYSAIIAFLQNGTLPDDKLEARRTKHWAARFSLGPNGTLFRRSFQGPSQRCLSKAEADEVLREVHEGVLGNHVAGGMLTQKIIRLGYFWPTMKIDSKRFAQKCQVCQRYSNNIHRPAAPMTFVEISWPFDQWGIDLVGPFPMASGQRKFLVVAVEYFTKWVEAEALAKITDSAIQSFLWKNIFCRFGAPQILISDNGI